MATEPSRRIAQLPGYDTAPDVYETPDIDDSTTTGVPTEVSETSEEEEDADSEDDDNRVSRQRLYPERARSRFGTESKDIDARKVDLSDRVDGRRQGFRVRRGREDEQENLEAKIARLRREVEECRAEAEAERANEDEDGDEEEDEERVKSGMDALTRMMSEIDIPAHKTRRRKGSIFHDALPTASAPDQEKGVDPNTLTQISAFDTRLSALESALGLSTTTDTDTAPLLPTLTLLDQQFAVLNSSTSLANLEGVASRISKLKVEAQQLQQSGGGEEEEGGALPPEEMQKLQQLYTILPTIQSYANIVPALLTRWRSLRTLHATAATAAQDLDSIEQRQGDMDRELKMWREGLEKVEKAVTEANAANGRNGNFVKEWIEDLQGRMKALGR